MYARDKTKHSEKMWTGKINSKTKQQKNKQKKLHLG